MERYSKALGDVGLDGSTPVIGAKPNDSVFESRSHVLDLLNTTFVLSYSNAAMVPARVVRKDGIEFDAFDFAPFSFSGGDLTLRARKAEGDTLAVVTSMTNSNAIADRTPVAHITIVGQDKTSVEYDLLAGRDTSESDIERPDIIKSVRHAAAPIFDSFRDPGPPPFRALRYLARIPFGRRMDVKQVSIGALPGAPPLRFWKASVFDTSTKRTATLLEASRIPALEESRWQTAYERGGALILRNLRVLPRAWLTPSAESVTADEALRRIQGTSETPFDTRRTALLGGNAPGLKRPEAGGSFSGTAKVTRRPTNGLIAETSSDRPAVLVVSEINYPGWKPWHFAQRDM